ncbi:MAG TPA: hypothetical protein VF938_05115, partial [Candidatus Angelobacter sp.]
MPTLDTFINRGVILTLRDARLRDLLPEGRIALGDKVQNRRIGLTCFLDFDIPCFMKNVRRKPASIAKTRWAAYAGSNSLEAAIHYSGLLDVPFPPHKDHSKT